MLAPQTACHGRGEVPPSPSPRGERRVASMKGSLAAGSGRTRGGELCDYFEKVRARTLRVADCIPADRVEWTWAPGKFTLGDVLRHLAGIERDMYAENALLRPSRYSGCGRDLADGLPSVRAFVDRSHAEAMAIFRSLS